MSYYLSLGRSLLREREISRPQLQDQPTANARKGRAGRDYEISARSEPDHVLLRLFLMSYFPSGFWSRLLTRILADDSVVEIVRNYFIIPEEMQQPGGPGLVTNSILFC